MFVYEKKLQYPVKIKNTSPRLASVIISQYGGPDGELGASMRYLSQRYSMPYPEVYRSKIQQCLIKNDVNILVSYFHHLYEDFCYLFSGFHIQ